MSVSTYHPAMEIRVALKEWANVCRALEDGRQILLLRKGGIHEAAGEFELEHRRFLLYPTYLHQNAKMLKPAERAGLQEMAAEPAKVRISAVGEVTDIVPVVSRAVMDTLDDQHVWAAPLIDMRFNYRPENPLYVLLVRVSGLGEPVTIDNTPAYAGCKSWVPLDRGIETDGMLTVLGEARYQSMRRQILDRLGAKESK
jgi:hypothetical protein